jgi:CubicO group peptidase (beta-lactamase class C family)
MKNMLIKAVAIIVTIIILILFYSVIQFSPQYMLRILKYGESDVNDYKIFPSRVINKAEEPYFFEKKDTVDLNKLPIQYLYNNRDKSARLDELLERTGTTAFIVISNEKIVYEKYFNGYMRDSVNTSFSAAKSFVSLLVGMAIDDGYIDSVDEPITNYISELTGTDFELIAIKDLLQMRSPISYKEGNLWFGDDAKTYYMPDLRGLAINNTSLTKKEGDSFHYNNYHPLLLGLILERSTGETVATYMEKKLWSRIGTEFDASWSLDSEKTGFEKMESGINARAIDFAKVGWLVLNNGVWQGEQIISKEWLQQSFAKESLSFDEINHSFIKNQNTGYGYMWYSIEDGQGNYDVYALGKYGQLIYISPTHQTVIIRNGKEYGAVDWWPDIFKTMILAMNNSYE